MGRQPFSESVAARKVVGAGCPDPWQASDGAILADIQDVGYGNVTVRNADGYQGWEEHAPYDGIIVTAAAPHVPPPLVAQLKPGGRLVIPVGLPHACQVLKLIEKHADGSSSSRDVLGVAFVPLTRSEQKPERP